MWCGDLIPAAGLVSGRKADRRGREACVWDVLEGILGLGKSGRGVYSNITKLPR